MLLLLENCESRAHEAQTPREQMCRGGPRHRDHRTSPAPVLGRRHSDTPGKQGAEAAVARESDLHADIGDRSLAGDEQVPGVIEPCLDPDLVRRVAKHRAELSNEMKWRHRRFSRHFVDGLRTIVHLAQRVASTAETHKRVIREHWPPGR